MSTVASNNNQYVEAVANQQKKKKRRNKKKKTSEVNDDSSVESDDVMELSLKTTNATGPNAPSKELLSLYQGIKMGIFFL